MQTLQNGLSHRVVPQEQWLEARKGLLEEEKAFTRQRDALSRKQRELPWVKVQKPYVFEGEKGRETLSDLFDGRSQLLVYHFMFGPEWKEGCPSCSFHIDHAVGAVLHLAQRDVTMVLVSRATYPQIEAFRKRMGWNIKWVSSYGNGFNYDYRVSFTKEEMESGQFDYNYGPNGFPADEAPGTSVFYKDKVGQVYHTYSSYARGGDIFLGTYNYLDITPKGRNEDPTALHKMTWVRHHDRYEQSGREEMNGQYAASLKEASSCGCGME